MTKNNREFQDFLRDEVNLNQGRLDRLNTSVGAVVSYLKEHLTGYQKMEPQGSYALGTLIKPVDDKDEYDADIQIVMNHNSAWEAKHYVHVIYNTLKENKNYVDKLRLKTRCVTIDYAGDFHLDVVPRVTIKGKHYVCNRVDNKFEETDGTGYRDWFNKQNRITNGNLKRVVRLLKYLRDHKGNYVVKSILLTTLAGNTIKPCDKDTEDVSTVADTLVTVLSRMDRYLQQHPNMPQIRNPVLATETFNRHWNQTRYANFRKRVHAHTQTAERALKEPSGEKAVKIWQELFGETFGKDSGGGNSGGGQDSRPSSPKGKPGGAAIPAATISATVTPTKQHASSDLKRSLHKKQLSSFDLEWIGSHLPAMTYNADSNEIVGTIDFCAEYASESNKVLIGEDADPQSAAFLCDSYLLRIDLNAVAANGWPKVYEIGGRREAIAAKHHVSSMDLHFYPADKSCCLGIRFSPERFLTMKRFIVELVIPFLYRLSYVDKNGLLAARSNLWGEYDHINGQRQYVSELLDMISASPGRNQACPCNSSRKFKNCHFDDVKALQNATARSRRS